MKSLVKNLILIVAGGHNRFGREIVESAKLLGYSVWVTDTVKNIEAFNSKQECEYISELDYLNPSSVIEQLNIAISESQIDIGRIAGVLTPRELAVISTSIIANFLQVPGNSFTSVQMIRNKHACRLFLSRLGYKQPASLLCSSAKDAENFMVQRKNHAKKFIVKPNFAMGSSGVSLVDKADDLEDAMANLQFGIDAMAKWLISEGHKNIPPELTFDNTFLIEEFQEGKEYSAEGYFNAKNPVIITLTSKITTGPPFFQEIGEVMPAVLDENTKDKANIIVKKALKDLGLSHGLFHVEFWVNESEIILGEIHARNAGAMMPLMVNTIINNSMFNFALHSITEQDIFEVPSIQCGSAITHYFPRATGTIASISGWELIKSDSTFVGGNLHYKVGDVIDVPRSFLDVSTYIVTKGKTGAEAIDNAYNLIKKLEIKLEDGKKL